MDKIIYVCGKCGEQTDTASARGDNWKCWKCHIPLNKKTVSVEDNGRGY